MSGQGPPHLYSLEVSPPYDRNRQDMGVPTPPHSLWVGEQLPLVFAAPAGDTTYGPVGGVVTRATWQSQIIDLRPYLGGATGSYPNAKKISPAYKHVAMTITIVEPATPAINASLEVHCLERAHPTNPARLDFIGPRQNITTDFYDFSTAAPTETGTNNVRTFSFRPPRGMRFWRVTLVFDALIAGAPSFTAQGVMY